MTASYARRLLRYRAAKNLGSAAVLRNPFPRLPRRRTPTERKKQAFKEKHGIK